MQRYLQYDYLKECGLTHFDAWAANFAQKVTKLEYAPTGKGFRQKTRLAKFTNLLMVKRGQIKSQKALIRG